jgi:hypothetical protein
MFSKIFLGLALLFGAAFSGKGALKKVETVFNGGAGQEQLVVLGEGEVIDVRTAAIKAGEMLKLPENLDDRLEHLLKFTFNKDSRFTTDMMTIEKGNQTFIAKVVGKLLSPVKTITKVIKVKTISDEMIGEQTLFRPMECYLLFDNEGNVYVAEPEEGFESTEWQGGDLMKEVQGGDIYHYFLNLRSKAAVEWNQLSDTVINLYDIHTHQGTSFEGNELSYQVLEPFQEMASTWTAEDTIKFIPLSISTDEKESWMEESLREALCGDLGLLWNESKQELIMVMY